MASETCFMFRHTLCPIAYRVGGGNDKVEREWARVYVT